jgi:hypothetical protein
MVCFAAYTCCFTQLPLDLTPRFRGKEMASNSQEVQNIFKIEAKEFSLAKAQEREISKNLEQAQKLEKSHSYDLGR